MGVNITTIAYLRVLVIEIGSAIIVMVVEAQGMYHPLYKTTKQGQPVAARLDREQKTTSPKCSIRLWNIYLHLP